MDVIVIYLPRLALDLPQLLLFLISLDIPCHLIFFYGWYFSWV